MFTPIPALRGNPTGFCCWKSLTSLSDGRLLEDFTGCLAWRHPTPEVCIFSRVVLLKKCVSKNADAKNEEEKLSSSLQRQNGCVEILSQGILVQSNTVKHY